MQTVAAPSNLATTIRLMAGHELVTEGFAEGQVGSSAMPHKMNTRSCERVNGLAVVLRGHLAMVGELAGDQWNEGDVSCSVVRRVALPDAFFATDGLFRTFLTVLDEFGAFPAVIQRELDRYLPFLATTKVLMAAVRAGVGREAAHEAIKESAVTTALGLRAGQEHNDLLERLAADPRLGLDRAALDGVLAAPIEFTGAARAQVAAVLARVDASSPPIPTPRATRPARSSRSPGAHPHHRRHERGREDDEREGEREPEPGVGRVRVGAQLVDGHERGRAERRTDPLAGLQRPTGRAAHPRRHLGQGEREVRRDHRAAAEPGEQHRRRQRPPQRPGVRARADDGDEGGARHHHEQRRGRDPAADPRHQPAGQRRGRPPSPPRTASAAARRAARRGRGRPAARPTAPGTPR